MRTGLRALAYRVKGKTSSKEDFSSYFNFFYIFNFRRIEDGERLCKDLITLGINYHLYIILAELTGVARGMKKIYFFPFMLPIRYPWVPSQNVSQFGPTVWPAIANMYKYMSDQLYYTEDKSSNYSVCPIMISIYKFGLSVCLFVCLFVCIQ